MNLYDLIKVKYNKHISQLTVTEIDEIIANVSTKNDIDTLISAKRIVLLNAGLITANEALMELPLIRDIYIERSVL